MVDPNFRRPVHHPRGASKAPANRLWVAGGKTHVRDAFSVRWLPRLATLHMETDSYRIFTGFKQQIVVL